MDRESLKSAHSASIGRAGSCRQWAGESPAIESPIWEPFFTTKGVGNGTGLGLDIARRVVVKRHRGNIRFFRTGQDALQVPVKWAFIPMIDINTLRQVPLFAELSDEQLQWLAEQGTEVWLSRVIHRAQGDPADHVFVMLLGEFGLWRRLAIRS